MSPELSKPSLAIFGGEYNAKGRKLQEIATTFVPPEPTFGKLVQANNTLLIGPRGSGKTTLMKMLQSDALEMATNPRVREIAAAVDYSAVLVPGDESWGRQLEALEMDVEDGQRFAVAIFTLHCLRAIVRAAASRCRPPQGPDPHGRVSIEYPTQQSIARQVAQVWGVGTPVLDLVDLSQVLSDSISRLGQLRSSVERMSDKDRHEITASEPLLHLDLLAAAIPLIERFNHASDESEHRWAFLFDEAELVPSIINELIFRLLRGTDELFLFKVSYAPYENADLNLLRPLRPQEANDFTTLRLTYANKREAFPFTDALFRARLAQAKIDVEPDELLGTSSVVAIETDGTVGDEDAALASASYAPDSPYGELLAELAAHDPTFVEWLERNRLGDLDHAHELPEELRARLRKVLPVVALRVEYRRDPRRAGEGRSPTELRGRRNVTLYSGREAFYSMMEANPRWLQHVSDRLLEDVSRRGRLSAERQSARLRAAATEFETYLRILPVRGTHLQMDDGPKRLLNRIGQYFRGHYVRGDFDADPYGSFIVDAEFSDTVTSSLRALINRGAVVEVPGSGDSGLHGLNGKRFRPAYILAPLYGLPLRLDNAVGLSRILSASPSGQLRIASDQMTLGDE